MTIEELASFGESMPGSCRDYALSVTNSLEENPDGTPSRCEQWPVLALEIRDETKAEHVSLLCRFGKQGERPKVTLAQLLGQLIPIRTPKVHLYVDVPGKKTNAKARFTVSIDCPVRTVGLDDETREFFLVIKAP